MQMEFHAVVSRRITKGESLRIYLPNWHSKLNHTFDFESKSDRNANEARTIGLSNWNSISRSDRPLLQNIRGIYLFCRITHTQYTLPHTHTHGDNKINETTIESVYSYETSRAKLIQTANAWFEHILELY